MPLEPLSWGSTKLRQIMSVLFALDDPALIAGLILGAEQPVRGALLDGRGVDVAIASPDRGFDMATAVFRGPEFPYLAAGIAEKSFELPTILARAVEVALTVPVFRWRERFVDASAQMLETGRPQPFQCWRAQVLGLGNQRDN